MDLIEILDKAKKHNASDILFTVASPPIARINGNLKAVSADITTESDTLQIVKKITSDSQFNNLAEVGEIDLAYNCPVGRYRVNIFRQSGSYALALRSVNSTIPAIKDLSLPEIVTGLCHKKRGLILVTGPTGSGKSTTLAAMINHINTTRNEHIITIEDPVEYIHKHKKSIVNQREVGFDTNSFANALRAALREDPDIILVGEMRDLETIQTALTAAETGHLVLSTLHTIGSAKTIDRIVDVFPPHQQSQVKTQLASVLQAVISQQLLPKKDVDGRIGAFEVMVGTNAISSLIREGKTHQLQTIIQTSSKNGMCTMDGSLVKLYKDGVIDQDNALKYAIDYDTVNREINNRSDLN